MAKQLPRIVTIEQKPQSGSQVSRGGGGGGSRVSRGSRGSRGSRTPRAPEVQVVVERSEGSGAGTGVSVGADH
jgi:hypothetical protein